MKFNKTSRCLFTLKNILFQIRNRFPELSIVLIIRKSKNTIFLMYCLDQTISKLGSCSFNPSIYLISTFNACIFNVLPSFISFFDGVLAYYILVSPYLQMSDAYSC